MNEILPMVLSALDGASAAGVFRGPVQTLQDRWFIAYGSEWSEKAEKMKEQQRLNVQKFSENLSKDISEIPVEYVQEPPLNIIGPALEASKFYIEYEELRNMFSKLLASSMNSSKNDFTHNSFVEIIKQLSPLDAENIKIIFQKVDSNSPVTNIIADRLNSTGYKILVRNYFLENINMFNQNKINSSLENLKRLGLIELNYDIFLSDDKLYKKFEESPLFIGLKQTIETVNSPNSPLSQNFISDDFLGLEIPRIEKGIIRMTQFGKDFSEVCIN